ncbi:hypothetical protein ACP4OV_007339 [Aristida adscensionis]
MAPRSSSAAMRSIRRELRRRRPRPLAPSRPPPTKKTSATPPSTKKTSATPPPTKKTSATPSSRAALHPGRETSLLPRQDPPSTPLKTAPRASSAATTRSIRLEKTWPPAPTKPPATKKTSATPPAAKKTSATPPAAKKTSATPPAAKKTSATPPAAKKTSATPPAAKKTSATPPAAKKTSSAAPPSRTERDPGRETSLRQPSRPAACPVDSACAAETMRPGTAVLARTRTATLRTGQVLVLWLKAVVVSATEGGYEIVYEGGWPRDDPCATVQIARDHVRLRKPTPSTIPPPPQPPSSAARSRSSTASSAATAPKKKMKPTPRPTTAGKSVRVVRKLFPELFDDDSDTTAPMKEMKPAPRPTRAGKSIRLVRKLWPET